MIDNDSQFAGRSPADETIKSPAWHEAALQETEARLAAGLEQILDWDEAKRELMRKVRKSTGEARIDP